MLSPSYGLDVVHQEPALLGVDEPAIGRHEAQGIAQNPVELSLGERTNLSAGQIHGYRGTGSLEVGDHRSIPSPLVAMAHSAVHLEELGCQSLGLRSSGSESRRGWCEGKPKAAPGAEPRPCQPGIG